MNVVYSTLSTPMGYSVYPEIAKDMNGPVEPTRVIYIKGGAGVANKNLFTPLGVPTQISDADLAILQKDPTFKKHMKNGYVKVEAKERKVEKAIVGMNLRDKSHPKVPGDYKDSFLKPKVNLNSANSMGH